MDDVTLPGGDLILSICGLIPSPVVIRCTIRAASSLSIVLLWHVSTRKCNRSVTIRHIRLLPVRALRLKLVVLLILFLFNFIKTRVVVFFSFLLVLPFLAKLREVILVVVIIDYFLTL